MNKPTAEFCNYIKAKGYSSKTIDSYSRDIEDFFSFIHSQDILFDKINVDIVRKYLYEEMQKGVSKRSCQRRMSALRSFYDFLNRNNYCSINPFRHVSSPKADITYPKALYLEEVTALFEANSKRSDELKVNIMKTLHLMDAVGF